MELKPGYKQTEVGVIPEDWDVCQLKDFVDINSGESPSKYQFVNEGIPYYKVEQLNAGIKYIEETPYMLKVGKTVPAGSIIFPKRGASILLNKIRIMKKDSFMDTNLMTLTATNGLVNEYLFYCLDFQGLAKIADTTSIPQINNKHINPFKIPLPPTKAEQTAIANVLSDADALIQSLTRLIAKKRQIKQGAMQTLLNPYESGRLKEGWVVKKLGEAADIDPENLNASVNPNYKFKYISLEDVDRGVLRNYSDQIFATAPSRARRIVKKGDILFGTVRPNLQSHCLIKNHVEDLVCSTGFAVIRCRDNIANPPYIFSLFFAEFVEKQIQTLLAGSNYPAINSSDVRKLDIPLPQMDEQTHIAKILSDMDAEIAALETKLAKYQHIKQGMMQNLLTGRIRLI